MLTLLRHRMEPWSGPSAGKGWRAFQPDASSVCRVATGRSALRLLADKLRPSAVLMPSFVAEGVLQPFIEAGIRVIFYRLQEDLSPDLSDIEALLSGIDGRCLAILLHYFGYITPSAALSKLDAGTRRIPYLRIVRMLS